MATFIIFLISIYHLNRHCQISGCHHLMKELFLLLRNFRSKIIQDTEKIDTHTETLGFSFFGKGWEECREGRENRKG